MGEGCWVSQGKGMIWQWEKAGWVSWPAESLMLPNHRDQRERLGEASLTWYSEAPQGTLCLGVQWSIKAVEVTEAFPVSLPTHHGPLSTAFPNPSSHFSLSIPANIVHRLFLSFLYLLPQLSESAQKSSSQGALWNPTFGINHHFLCSHSDCLTSSL